MSGWDALYLSYAVAWGALFLYLLYLHRRIGKLAAQLRGTLAQGGKTPDKPERS